MSNLETEPEELVCPPDPPRGIEILEPRDVPLGGPRAMGVRRTLPQKARSLIGAWCFVDHYGPEPIAMDVPPHPHTGLQTVSWLFSGEIEHRDGVGSHAVIVPGGLNLMTAGRGIAHSEVSLRSDAGATPPLLHGAQLWIALPDSARHGEPFFETYTPHPVTVGSATVRVFLGSLAGSTSTAQVFSELLGAQIDLPAGRSVTLDVDPRFELGILLDAGALTVAGADVPVSHLAYLPPGSETLTLTAGSTDARLLLIGGVPLGEQIVMWWNFIGRTHEEIVEYREDWESGRRFAPVTGYDGDALPAPVMPPIRLRPRG